MNKDKEFVFSLPALALSNKFPWATRNNELFQVLDKAQIKLKSQMRSFFPKFALKNQLPGDKQNIQPIFFNANHLQNPIL